MAAEELTKKKGETPKKDEEKAGPSRGKAEQTKKEELPHSSKLDVKNFAPTGEGLDCKDGDNILHWEAYIGGQYYVKLATWKKNNRKYLQIRKNANIGANIECNYLDCLINALTALKQENKGLLGSTE
jgi:hypothetical protein